MERVRLAGLEWALDAGTREHLARLGAGPGARCLEIGAGSGSVAFWLAERVAPGGVVVATDLETDFLESEARGYPSLEVVRHDITAEDPPTGFDLVHARYLVEWLPDKRGALRCMASALRPGGALLIEEPDFVTLYGSGDSLAVQHVFVAAMRHLESICPIDCRYGQHALGDLAAVGLRDVQAEGCCPIVRGGTPLARDFLGLADFRKT
jgi:SAM-dependent methyltransferase